MAKDINWVRYEDRNILEKNTISIMNELIEGYGFSQKEIDDMYSRYNAQAEYKNFVDYLQQGSERERLFADLYFAVEIENLERVNDIISGNVEKLTEKDLRLMKILGQS